MTQPTTNDPRFDTIVSALTQVALYAHQHITRRELVIRLRATPIPTEPVTLTLYRMLQTLADYLPVGSTTNEIPSNDAEIAP